MIYLFSFSFFVFLFFIQGSDSKSNVEGFSQLLRLICWCPAYVSTPNAMETGVFVWTWLVSAAPQLGSLVLAELVDAWLWTIDTKRGLFASDAKYYGPAAKLRPHLVSGEPEALPEINPVEQIISHRLWLGFFIDRFEVRNYITSLSIYHSIIHLIRELLLLDDSSLCRTINNSLSFLLSKNPTFST